MSRQDRRTIVTTLYAVVRATAQTSAAYQRMDDTDTERWLALASATAAGIPDVDQRHPHSELRHISEDGEPDWRTAPRDAVRQVTRLLVTSLNR